MTTATYTISQMKEKEVEEIAIQWAKAEGWNPGLHDAKAFYAQDPHGFFVGRLGNQVIGCCSAVIYDENFAFFGFYIVKPDFRQQGYGIQMTRKRLQYVENRNIGLDGVLDMCNKYANIGFRPAHHNIRYQGQIYIKEARDPLVVLVTPSLIPLVEKFDRLYFPAPRNAFLNVWLKQSSDNLSLVYMHEGDVKGYGVIRRCFKGYKIGPLFAESFEIADKIFRGLAAHAQGEILFLDVPEINLMALKLVERYKMQSCFKTLRMYTKETPHINLDHVYGITTFELG